MENPPLSLLHNDIVQAHTRVLPRSDSVTICILSSALAAVFRYQKRPSFLIWMQVPTELGVGGINLKWSVFSSTATWQRCCERRGWSITEWQGWKLLTTPKKRTAPDLSPYKMLPFVTSTRYVFSEPDCWEGRKPANTSSCTTLTLQDPNSHPLQPWPELHLQGLCTRFM